MNVTKAEKETVDIERTEKEIVELMDQLKELQGSIDSYLSMLAFLKENCYALELEA